MTPADRLILDALKPHMTDLGYQLVVAKVGKAGSIQNLRDSVAIAELTKAKDRFEAVNKLRFGNASEAGRYAANQRWYGHNMVEGPYGDKKVLRTTVNGQTTSVKFRALEKPHNEVKIGDMVLDHAGNPAWVMSVRTQPHPQGTRTILTTKPVKFTTDRKGNLQTKMRPEDVARHGGSDSLRSWVDTKVTTLRVLDSQWEVPKELQ
jgi:hypothetical protein